MKSSYFIAVLLALLTGCGKQESPAPVAQPKPPTTMPSLQPAGAKSTGTTAPSQLEAAKVPILNTKVDLDALTKALVNYCKKTQANPISLDEVVKAGFLPGLPALPPGKKFDIDRDTYKVIIVDAPPPADTK